MSGGMRISVNTFETDDRGLVAQVFVAGMPVTRELEPAAALAAGWDTFGRAYGHATLQTWDGRTDTTLEIGRKP